MTRLIIAGAGGFGRELAAYARNAGFSVVGFLDDNPRAADGLAGHDADPGIVGSISTWDPAGAPGALLAIGLGHGATRVSVGDALVARGARLTNVIHPTAWVAPTAVLGAGVALAPFTCVGPGVHIGDLSMLNTYASLGHDAQLGRGCVMASYAVATGFTVLEDEAFLATHAIVTPSVRIGARARVSAGAVVFSDIPPGHLAFGNPARSRAVPEG
jgi:sugar O-acyltransferase (sialic acid O-acetyltransferase NeuD family)